MKRFSIDIFYFFIAALILNSCQNLHKETIIPVEMLTGITDLNSFLNDKRNTDSTKEVFPMSSVYGKKTADIQAKVWNNNPELIYVFNDRITVFPVRTTTTTIVGGKVHNQPLPKMFRVSEWIYIYKSPQNVCLIVIAGNEGIVNAGFFSCRDSILSDWQPIPTWKKEPNIDIEKEYISYALFNITGKPIWKCESNTYSFNNYNDRFDFFDADTGEKFDTGEINKQNLFSSINGQ